jgi:ketosteroid isomerase-like protein
MAGMGGNGQVVEAAYEAFGRGDIAAVIGMVADDVDWSSPETLPQGGHFRGKDGVERFFQAIGSGWSDLSLEVETVSEASPDLVVGVVQATGTRRDGGSSGYGATHLFTVQTGKITRFREFTDLGSPLT